MARIKTAKTSLASPQTGCDQERQEYLQKLESQLNQREVQLIERELKFLNLYQELDKLRKAAEAYEEIENLLAKIIETLAYVIDKRDPLTSGHSIRVTHYSLSIGEKMHVLESKMKVLRYAALMHDFGKIGIPEAILWKAGCLTQEEYACVQTHARLTFELLSKIPFAGQLSQVPFIASCHHEKLDGTGYYRGLAGQEIPFLARIISVADVFDALTSVRHYRNRMHITRVHEIMEAGRGNHFDPEIVDAFYQLPCACLMKIMESERGFPFSKAISSFERISWLRLMELFSGAKPKRYEIGLTELFGKIYDANLEKITA